MTVALRSLPPLPRVVIAPAVTKGSWTLLKLSNAETVVSQGTSHDRPYDKQTCRVAGYNSFVALDRPTSQAKISNVLTQTSAPD